MNKLVSRSLEILCNTTVEIGKDYTSNLTSLVTDAQNVKNSIVKSTTDASDIYSKLKNTNITKKISDWFYDRESEADSSGSDEFDAGFKIESSDDHALDGDEKPKALNFESMSDISEKQTNAMFKIGRRQTEQTVANTAEIISTLNSRSSEMIASMNNINKTLMGISDRIDKLIQISTIESSNEPKEVDKGGLFSDGKLTLSGIFEASKQALTQNSVVSIATSTLQALQSGQFGPEALLSGLLKATVLDKKIDSFGGKSINDIGKGFNDMVGTITQTALSEILGSKYLKDVVTFQGDKDYGSMVQSHYDTKKAQFDGMTRMSIISVIPEYLNKINESLSGKTYHIDNSGKLVEGPRTNRFVEVTDHSFSSSGLSSKIFDKIEANAKKVVSPEKLSTEDINAAAKALTMSIVWDMHYKGQRLFRQSDLKRDMTPYIEYACSVLCRYKNDPQYWASICQTIVLQLSMGFMDSAQFVQNVNQSLQNMINSATEFAQSGDPSASQASRITFEMVSDRFLQQNFPGSTKNNNTVTPTVSSNTMNTNQSSTIVDGAIGGNKNDDQKGKYSSYDYIRGIFGILNRGINVRTTNKPKNTKGYGNYPIERQSTDQIKDDEKFGDMMMGMMANSTGDDAKDMSSLITQGIKDATTSILGEEGANAASQAMGSGGGLSGFFGNMIGNLGASGMNKMFTRFMDGTLSKEVKAFFNEGGKGQKLANDVKGKLTSAKNAVVDAIPESLKHDKRSVQIGDAIFGDEGFVQNARGVGSKAWGTLKSNETFQNTKKRLHKGVNNVMYAADSFSVNHSNDVLNNVDTSTIKSFEDRMAAERALMYFKQNDLQNAEIEVSSIEDIKLRKAFHKHLEKINNVGEKRQAAETALANGETPDIGAVFDDSQIGSSSDKKGGIISVVKKGFSMVGKVLKQIAKLAGEGVMNITFGLKSMTEGLFGSKHRDANGNVVRNSGLIRNLTTDLYKATKSAIGNMPIAREGGMTVNEGIGKVKQGIKNVGTTIWRGREVGRSLTNDENGQLHSESIRSGGLSQMKITRSSNAKVEDLIKAPAQTLKQVMSDVGASFKTFAEKHMPTFVKVFNWASKKIKKTADETGQKKGLFGRAGDAFRKTTFGSGFMSGFDEAKAAKKKLSEHAERMSSFPNRAIGNIMDVIMGKSNGKSAFTEICDLITGLRDDMNKNHKEDMNIQEDDDKKPDDDKSTSGSGTGQMKEEATETEASPKTSSGKGATKGFRAIGKEIVGNIGKMMGGFSQALLGIGQLVLSIVASLEGLQALKDMVMSILTDGLQPLNAIFESVMDLIKPIVDIMKGAVTTIADTIVTIAGSLISAIQPLMETLTPIIETMLDVLNPILDLFKVVADIIMVPLLIAVKAMQPVVEHIGNVLTIMSGFLQVGMGAIITVLGSILTAVGWIVSKFSGNDDLLESGKDMVQQGAGMVVSGGKQIAQGFVSEVDLLKRMLPGGDPLFKSDENEKPAVTSTGNTDNVNINGGAMGSGDVDNRVITQNSYVYNNTYGSGNRTTMNQHTYGSYMNMSERGCGPVALADAYSRRTGNNISPVSLASRMAGSGAYEPNRGTSVGSFIRTGNAMGMNMRVGGVTQASLKRATPNNPITLLGSGSDYGTRSGNDHYVNVIGTDRYGGAYVSNPLTGRVDRRSASTLALNSRLGLYGSGDSSDLFSFDANTTDAMTKLKNLTSRLTGMFTGESTSDSISRKINEGEEETQLNEIKRQLGEGYEATEAEALEAFKSANPKRADESDEEYEKRVSSLWQNPSVYRKYMIDFAGQAAIEKMEEMHGEMNKGLSYFIDEGSGFSEFINKIGSVGSPNDINGSLMSESGAVMAPYSPIRYTNTNITKKSSGESPVHDFFSATNDGMKVYTVDGGWFDKTNNPDSSGKGTTGGKSEGVAITFEVPNRAVAKAITGGVVTYVGKGGKHGYSDPNGGLGNHVKWRDASGMYHWYLHLKDIANNIAEGSNIEPGQDVGHIGDTGYSGENNGRNRTLLRYIVTSAGPYGSTGDSGYINPLTYWRFKEENNQEAIQLTDDMKSGSIWSGYGDKLLNAGYFDAAKKAGLSAAQTAMIAAIGIYEDSAKKLTGEKSLTKVTQDRNGQYAFGIMNWIPDAKNSYVGADETKYGSTLSEQLPYMLNAYFTDNATHERAKIVNYDRYSSAMQEAMGHAPKLKQGDRWGPYAETDIVEAMGHYVANALIPDGWNTKTGLETRMGTAAEAYNWMVEKGLAKAGSYNNENGGKNGTFVSTKHNMIGGKDSLIRTLAMMYEAYVNQVPSGTYSHASTGPYTLRDGTVVDKLRPDCSGFVSAAIKHMGYTIKGDTGSGVPSESFANAKSNNIIMDGSGNLSSDWIIIPAQGEQYEAGDITNTLGGRSSYWPNPHSSMPIIDINGYTKGFDGGGTNNIINSAKAATRYLNGDQSYTDFLHSAMDTSASDTILRYVGGTANSNYSTDRGGFTYGEYTKDSHNVFSENGYDAYNISDVVKQIYSSNNKQPTSGGNNTNTSSKTTYTTTVKPPTHSSGGGSHSSGLSGSGDVSSDFWYDSLFNNQSPFSQDIPPLDDTAFTDYDNTGLQPYRNIINRYEITSDDSNKTELLNKMSKMTFNVRAQRVEELLEELIEKVDGNKPKPTSNNSGTDLNLFKDNGIPEQVTRLSRG